MYYWNKDNFEGLAQIEERLRDDTHLQPLSRYCELRGKGLRAAALDVVREFVRSTNSWPAAERHRAADRLLSASFENREAHQFLTQPLVDGFVLPALLDWENAAPGLARPVRWRGLLCRDHDACVARWRSTLRMTMCAVR